MKNQLRTAMAWLAANEPQVRLGYRCAVIFLLLVLIARVDKSIDLARGAYNYSAEASEFSRRAMDICDVIRR